MTTIVMDTSNQYLAVGIYQDGQLIANKQMIGSKRQSEEAIPVLNALCEEAHIELRDVDEMIITKGPGSYTGVRVAMTIAKTLAVISNVKIKTISSLAAYGADGKKIAIIDARSKKVFACVYEDGQPLTEEMLLTHEELATLQEKYPDYALVGELKALDLPNVDVDLVRAIYDLGQQVKPIEQVDLLVPTYIKDVEAKKKWY